ncbi:hypothetical protein FRC12_024905 [Ceratobasidium sp. 428]|nr:hypothetical protein FRC12_024905 [Ceratobasidium sp. 428]
MQHGFDDSSSPFHIPTSRMPQLILPIRSIVPWLERCTPIRATEFSRPYNLPRTRLHETKSASIIRNSQSQFSPHSAPFVSNYLNTLSIRVSYWWWVRPNAPDSGRWHLRWDPISPSRMRLLVRSKLDLKAILAILLHHFSCPSTGAYNRFACGIGRSSTMITLQQANSAATRMIHASLPAPPARPLFQPAVLYPKRGPDHTHLPTTATPGRHVILA